MRDLVAKAVRDLGYRTDIEHGGGLGDQRRPGDVIVYNWHEGKHLLIDVAVINPLGVSHADDLVKDGVGGSATAFESVKKSNYPDIDFSVYDFVPFIIESCGGIGQAALSLCKELEDQREAKEYWKNREEGGWNLRKFPNPLLTAINIEIQRFNSRMILERQPPRVDLIETSFIKCEAEVAEKKVEAAKKIMLNSNIVIEQNQKINSYGVINLQNKSNYLPTVPFQQSRMMASGHPTLQRRSILRIKYLMIIFLLGSTLWQNKIKQIAN